MQLLYQFRVHVAVSFARGHAYDSNRYGSDKMNSPCLAWVDLDAVPQGSSSNLDVFSIKVTAHPVNNEMLNEKLIKWLSHPGPDRSINAAIGMPVVVGTDRGLVRGENQDRVAVMRVNSMSGSNSPFVVVALVDGMGGMIDGNQCAIKALAAFLNATIRFRHEPPEARLRLAAKVANDFVFEFSKGKGGATLSALLVGTDGRTTTLNVGDSRIYASLANSGEATVVRLTVDDSLEEAVGGSGKELLQFIGMGDGLVPHVDEVPMQAHRILLTSDGVHFVNHEVLCEILLKAQGEQEVADELLILTRRRGAPDNATLSVISLPKLRDSILAIDEAGIQFWDPFGALHILWLKQEVVDPQSKISEPLSNTPEKGSFGQIPMTKEDRLEESKGTTWDKHSISIQTLAPIKAQKKAVKKRAPRPKKKKEDLSDQLSIEIGPEAGLEK